MTLSHGQNSCIFDRLSGYVTAHREQQRKTSNNKAAF